MPTYGEINSYIQNIISAPDMTDAGKAAAIKSAAETFGVSNEQIAAATGYQMNDVNNFIGGGANANSSGSYTSPTTSSMSKFEESIQATASQLRSLGATEDEVNQFLDQQRAEENQFQEQIAADAYNYNKAQSDIEAMNKQEQEILKKQAADYESTMKNMQEQNAALQAQAQAQAAAIAAQTEAMNKKMAEEKEKNRLTLEGMQRDSAEKDVSRKKATRSTASRPILAGASADAPAPTLGVRSSMSQSGSLGGSQTLGVGG